MKKQYARLYWLIPLFWLLAFTGPHLDQGDFRTDSGYYAAIGLQMWDTGLLHYYTQPDVPYFNKPPVGFWIHGGFLKVFGVDLVVARIPSILAASGTLLLLFFLIYRLSANILFASASSFVLALTYEFFRRTREISLDHWQLFFMLAGIVLLLLYFINQEKGWLKPILGGVLLGLSLATKPMLGIIGFAVLGLWLITTRQLDWDSFFKMLATFALMMAFTVAWHLFMYLEFGDAFVQQYFGSEIVGRSMGRVQNFGLWYYPGIWLSTYWPWLPFLLFGGWQLLKTWGSLPKNQQALFIFLFIWLAVWITVLFVLPDKRPRYAMMVYPAFAVISAYGLIQWRWLMDLFEKRMLIGAALPLILFITVSFLDIKVQSPPDERWANLFAWIDKQQIAIGNVEEKGLSIEQTARFYLYFRGWPSNGDNPANQPKPYIVCINKSCGKFGNLAFQDKGLYLFKRPIKSEEQFNHSNNS